MNHRLSKPELIHIIAKSLRSGNTKRVERIATSLSVPELANIMLNLMPAEQKAFIEVLFELKVAGKTLIKLPRAMVTDLLGRCEDAFVTRILSRLPTRDSKAILRTLPEQRSQLLLANIENAKSGTITELLMHPEDSAADLMSTQFLALTEDTPVREALEYPRKLKREVTAYYIYIVDEWSKLIGVVPIHELLMVDPELPVSSIMERDVIQVAMEARKEEVADLVRRYNLLSIPVVDQHGVLKGVISIDSIFDVLQDEVTDDMYKIAGLDKQDRVFVSPISSVKKRLPWLSINVITALAGALVINYFQDTIDTVVALVIFMPVIAGLGGNTGAQVLTVIVRGLALGEVPLGSIKRVVIKEVIVGLLNGLFIGTLVALVAIVWKGSPLLGLIVALAMICNLVVASLIGTLVPMSLKYLGFDPAICSNIFVTATTDLCGFLIYLQLATLLLPYLK